METQKEGYKMDEYVAKIDVLDLLINLLREHEEKLDQLVTRLETLIPTE